MVAVLLYTVNFVDTDLGFGKEAATYSGRV
jgi:hypothetical protein